MTIFIFGEVLLQDTTNISNHQLENRNQNKDVLSFRTERNHYNTKPLGLLVHKTCWI